jgi:Leucine-rich repeat (LRR) protein
LLTSVLEVFALEIKQNINTLDRKDIFQEGDNLSVSDFVYTPSPSLISATITPTEKPTPLLSTSIPLNFKPQDVLMDPQKPFVYFLEKESKKLYILNYETSEFKSIIFDLEPNKLAIMSDELYVLLAGKGNSVVTILDIYSLSIIDNIKTDACYLGMVTDNDGYIYLSSNDKISSYSRKTKLKVDTLNNYARSNNLQYSTLSRKIYLEGYLYPVYKGKLYLENIFRDFISRVFLTDDGKYLLQSSGEVYSCAYIINYDLKYIKKIPNNIVCQTLNTSSNEIFTAGNDNTIYAYDYDSLDLKSCYEINKKISKIFSREESLYSVAESEDGSYNFVITPLECFTPLPVHTASPTSESGVKLPLNAYVSDSLLAPNTSFLYILDSANMKLYAVDLDTRNVMEKAFIYPPEKMEYYQGKIYITFVKGHFNSSPYGEIIDERGSLVVINPQTLEIEKEIELGINPLDITFDDEGNVFISSENIDTGYNKPKINSYSISTGKLISSIEGFRPKLSFNPNTQRLYTIVASDRTYSTEVIGGVLVTKYIDNSTDRFALDKVTDFKLSPDFSYLFSNSGNIFKCDRNSSNDLSLSKKLDKQFRDIAFNLKKNKFYTANHGKEILEYDYDSLKVINTYKSNGEVDYLYVWGNKLIALSKSEDNRLYVETIYLNEELTDPVITFADVNFERAVREVVNKPSGNILKSDVGNITLLNFHGKEITDLQGIQYFTSLTALNLGSNKITNLGPLRSLENLETLYLYENRITDISPLEGLKKLSTLSISTNIVENICALTNLTNLKTLHIFNNKISDVGPLRKLLNLQLLYAYNNRICGIDALKGLISLKNLAIGSNPIIDLSPVGSIKNLNELSVNNAQINNVNCLSGLKNLSNINLDNNKIEDISSLKDLKQLQSISLAYNKIENIESLSNMLNLNFVNFGNNKISDISPLSGNTEIKHLYLNNNYISNISALSTLGKVNYLNLRYNNITNISPLGKINSLWTLLIKGNSIKDYSPLSSKINHMFGDDLYLRYITGCVSDKLNTASQQSGFKVELDGTGFNTLTNPDGTFRIEAIVCIDNIECSLTISKLNYLTREIGTSRLERDSLQIGTAENPIELWAGDFQIDGKQDNSINMTDIIQIAKMFNTSINDVKYNSDFDLNKDDAINILDIMAIAKHFNKSTSDY